MPSPLYSREVWISRVSLISAKYALSRPKRVKFLGFSKLFSTVFALTGNIGVTTAFLLSTS